MSVALDYMKVIGKRRTVHFKEICTTILKLWNVYSSKLLKLWTDLTINSVNCRDWFTSLRDRSCEWIGTELIELGY